ncbi:hypothetical protein CBOM_07950 [Ceraceosorus bombacis]|uniref:Uncharacterized protein n=1 Tax=Ceraceosorus bombacis TaxID=401625 RepID=A0A0P1BSR7_9BASI|nr:hypothetical protein CBOM_07950 [Ceraceosorus bombacis]
MRNQECRLKNGKKHDSGCSTPYAPRPTRHSAHQAVVSRRVERNEVSRRAMPSLVLFGAVLRSFARSTRCCFISGPR